MGRPTESPDGQRREAEIRTRVTPRERAAIQEKAKRLGISVSELLVTAALAWEPQEKPLALPDRLQHLAERGAVRANPKDIKQIRQTLPEQ